MLQRRFGPNQDEGADQSGEVVAAETLRSAAGAGGLPGEKKDEEKMSLFWRVFGGTILSIVALTAITIYNNLSSNIAEVRGELSREREARTALAKREDVDSRLKSQYERIRAVEGYRAEIETIKERTSANTATVEAFKKDIGESVETLKKQTAGLDPLKERVVAVEAVKKDVAGIEVLKEKLTGLTADLRAARDEVQKLNQELEKNRAADLERKAFRDAQAKQLDETIKDLIKGVQDCREKLARLEGAQPAGPPTKSPGAGPARSASGEKP